MLRSNEQHIKAAAYDLIFSYRPYDEDVKRLIAAFELEPSHYILDVGCGTGAHLEELSRQLGAGDGFLFGVDADAFMINRAVQRNPSGVSFEQQDIRGMTLASLFAPRIDYAFSFFNTVNYMLTDQDLDRFSRACARVLHAGASLAFEAFGEHVEAGPLPILRTQTDYNDRSAVTRIGLFDLHRSTREGTFQFEYSYCDARRNLFSWGEEIEVRLWSALQLEHSLERNGFMVLHCGEDEDHDGIWVKALRLEEKGS